MAASDNPVLSICIPTYNRSALLDGLLREIDRPDYLPFSFEVIVSDNGSPDPGYAAIASFQPAHYRYSYVRRPENLGSYVNVYGSYRLANGEFCLHVADDDRLIPDGVAAIVNVMRGAPDCVATFAAWQMYDGEADAIVKELHFEDLSVTRADAALLASRMTEWSLSIPENGIFRTQQLGLSLYRAPATNVAYRLIEWLLLVGRVDFSSKPFYRVLSRHAGEQGPRNHASGSLGVEGWSGMARCISVFHRWATGEPLFDAPATPAAMLYLAMLRNAVYESNNRGRFLEAADMMEYLLSLTDAPLLPPDQQTHFRHMAALDSVRAELDSLPGVEAFHFIALGADAEPLRQMLVGGGSRIPVIATPYATAELDLSSAALVVPTDAMREQLIALYQIRPGFVFSLEAARRCFS